MADAVRVGAIVRVPLHGRRVRGWVVADAVEPEADIGRLLPLVKVSSAGPPADVVELCHWAAWRYAGPVAALLGAASPPNAVEVRLPAEVGAAVFPPAAALPDVVAEARAKPCSVIAWPPAVDRRELVLGLLASEGSTIVVVAAASRVPLLVRQLEREGRTPVVLHSDLPDAERTEMWDRARGGACVVVGGRVAVFAPVPDLSAMVVLDEGDEALKEERTPAWNAREVTVERARRAGVRVTLVSPVPTLEAEVHAGAPPLRPLRGVERSGWPPLEIVDLRAEPPGRSVLTTRLGDALREAVAAGRAVCVLNRKGRARMLVCATCGALATCARCDAAVAESDDGLACPRCGATRPRVCQACHGTQLKARRIGVTRVAEELSALLPHTKVAEVGGAAEIPADAEVLVGTEAVLHRAPPRPAVRLCAFLELDQELLAPRYRAAEQALLLLARAGRLVGPRSGPGRVLVQTRVPGHEVLTAARQADPTIAIAPDRVRRAELGFPPFGGLAEVSGDDEAVEAACAQLRARPDITVLGPSSSPARALFQAATVETLCDALAATDLTSARSHGRLRVEVDPLRV